MPTTPQPLEADAALRHPPEDENGVIRLQLDAESWEILADKKWVNEEFSTGRWAPYAGDYIAVVRKQLIGHGPDLLRLRADVARETGIRPGRIVMTYVEPPIEG